MTIRWRINVIILALSCLTLGFAVGISFTTAAVEAATPEPHSTIQP